MNWNNLKIFIVVAKSGSFTLAATALNMSQSAVSRQIISLEQTLNVSLFHRHARGLVLTEQGRILYSSARGVKHSLDTTQNRINADKDLPSGILTVNISMALGAMWLSPLMKKFKDIYPYIDVRIICSERGLDVSMLEADVAILQHESKSSGLVQKKIMRGKVKIYSSISYLERRGKPKSISDLNHHDLIVYDNTLTFDDDYNSSWLLDEGVSKHMQRKPIFSINNLHGIYRAIRSGLGIGSLPEFMEGLPGELINILPNIDGPKYDIFVVYPEEYKNIAKVQAFKKFIVETTKQTM